MESECFKKENGGVGGKRIWKMLG